ncbi:MAG: hypothetical protein ACYCUM_03885 [Solirubrobacteraceae bacterium]
MACSPSCSCKLSERVGGAESGCAPPAERTGEDECCNTRLGGTTADDRAIVALAEGRPIEVQLLYPELGIDEPLAAIADRYQLDGEALHAAAQSALAAPDRVVTRALLE